MDLNLYVLFSRSNGILARLIRLFTGGATNHSALAWQEPHLGWVVLGANQNGITIDTWGNFTASRQIVAMLRPKDTLRPLWMGLTILRDQINAKYDVGALVGMSVVEIARHLFNRNISNPLDLNAAEMFCSEFTVRVIRASGYLVLPEQAANTVDPQEELDALLRNPAFIKGAVPA